MRRNIYNLKIKRIRNFNGIIGAIYLFKIDEEISHLLFFSLLITLPIQSKKSAHCTEILFGFFIEMETILENISFYINYCVRHLIPDSIELVSLNHTQLGKQHNNGSFSNKRSGIH